jgi:ABC-type transporter Mla MlaB component
MPLYLHDEANAMRFKIQGELGGSCVTELESSWRTASSVMRGKSLVVDLTGVTSIDKAGEQLLVRMRKEGAHLIPESQVGEPILTGVSGTRAAAHGGRAPCRRLLERMRGLMGAKVMGT